MRRHVRFYAVLLALLAGCADHAAPRTTPSGRGTPGVTESSVRAHLEFLASDALNGRGSGTRDEQIAAEYVGAQFRRLGFEAGGAAGSFVQTVEIERRTTASPPVLVVGADGGRPLRWTHGKEILIGGVAREPVRGTLQRIDMKATPDPAVTPGAAVLLVNGAPQDAGALFRKGAAIIFTRKRPQIRARWQTPRPVGLPRKLERFHRAAGSRDDHHPGQRDAPMRSRPCRTGRRSASSLVPPRNRNARRPTTRSAFCAALIRRATRS